MSQAQKSLCWQAYRTADTCRGAHALFERPLTAVLIQQAWLGTRSKRDDLKIHKGAGLCQGQASCLEGNTPPPIHHTGPAGWKSWRSPTSLIPNKILALSWGEKGGSKGEFDLLGLLSTCTGVRAFYSTSCLILPRTHVTEALFPFILISQTK